MNNIDKALHLLERQTKAQESIAKLLEELLKHVEKLEGINKGE